MALQAVLGRPFSFEVFADEFDLRVREVIRWELQQRKASRTAINSISQFK